MKVMVTGSMGFIARHLIEKLDADTIIAVNHNSGHYPSGILNTSTDKVIAIYVDLTNEAWVKNLFQYYKPDIIFHLAAKQGKTPEAFNANVSMTSHLLKYAPDGCRFIYISSSTVYGNLANEMMDRRKCHEEMQTIPTSLYGASKLAGETLVHSYQHMGKIQPLILRYVATVGKDASHGVIPDILKKIQQPGDLELFGDYPGSRKPYMHIDDVIDATLHLVNNKQTGIFNISPSDEIAIQDIASYIRYKLDLDGKKNFKWLGSQALPPGDNPLVALDNSKLLQTDWQPKYQFSMESVAKAIEEICGY